MASNYYAPGQERSAKVRDLFASIASRYDFINDVQSLGLHRIWKRQLLQCGKARADDLVLDLCCGTGDIAHRLAGVGARVVGLDFSAPMLAVGSGKLSPKPTRHVTYVQGDALRLPFADRSFDLITVGYGLRNLADLEAGLNEMKRVLKPGGRLAALDFGKPRGLIWRIFCIAYLKCVVPFFGAIFCRDASAYAYILDSLKDYPGQHGVAIRLKNLDFTGVQVIELAGGAMAINFAQRRSQG